MQTHANESITSTHATQFMLKKHPCQKSLPPRQRDRRKGERAVIRWRRKMIRNKHIKIKSLLYSRSIVLPAVRRHPIPAALYFLPPAVRDSPAALLPSSKLCGGIEGREKGQWSDDKQMHHKKQAYKKQKPYSIPAALYFPPPAVRDSPAALLSLSKLCGGIKGRERRQWSDDKEK